jgi:Ca2+-binding EF-hand superfamily protein
LAFNIYDLGQDGQIDSTDLFALLKLFHKDDELFFEAFSEDLVTISKVMAAKRSKIGMNNIEVDLKLASVE